MSWARGATGKGVEVKVYLVLQTDNIAAEGKPNIRVIAGKLNRKSAQDIVDRMPGTSIQKLYVGK